tara:strand:- start:476 stop:1084 length:609 start_codon:yes stop_codon:yes gene_type:complete
MEKFDVVSGIAAPMPRPNIDTDQIIPARFLRTTKRTGLGIYLFNELRFKPDGSENPSFILNQPPYRDSALIVAGDNFGCGSSREHAPWALLDFGIRCVISTGFADIFFNNCFKNGLLPIVVNAKELAFLMREAENQTPLTVNLDKQTINLLDDTSTVSFDVDPFRKHCLRNGLDDIGLTLEKEDKITAFEEIQKSNQPWLYP